jgi:hypothetical protein
VKNTTILILLAKSGPQAAALSINYQGFPGSM